MKKKRITSTIFLTILLSILLSSFTSKIHDPQYASSILIEQEDGSWILQIHSAMTAFEHEVHTNFGKDSYKTAEEFNDIVVKHLLKNITIKINNKNGISLKNGTVKLGHETSVVFKVVGIPKKIETISFTNSNFKDIHNNQNTLIIIKKGFKKQNFLLNKKNEYHVNLKISKNQFVLQ